METVWNFNDGTITVSAKNISVSQIMKSLVMYRLHSSQDGVTIVHETHKAEVDFCDSVIEMENIVIDFVYGVENAQSEGA